MTGKVVLTVIVPEADLFGANHLAACLGWLEGWEPEEWDRAFRSQWRNENGDLYRVMSCLVGVSFVANATVMGPVDRPSGDVNSLIDLSAARAVQSKIVAWSGEGDLPQAAPDRVVAVVGLDDAVALAAMGLTPVAVQI